MDLEPGHLVSLIGPNGSGKTTLFKSMLGLVMPSSGTIAIKGIPVTTKSNYRHYLGYMPQLGRFPENIKVFQLFDLLKKLRPETASSLDVDLYDQFKIAAFNRLPLGSLSGGMKQKVNAAIAFLFNPEILILDEPTAGLDPIASEILKSKILAYHRMGKLIIISSHILSDIDDITTHVAYMQEGKLLYYGSFDALKSLSHENKLSKAIAYLMRTNEPKS